MSRPPAAAAVARAAHDLNNACATLLGFAALSRDLAERESTIMSYLAEIEAAAERAGDVAKRLQALAREMEHAFKGSVANFVSDGAAATALAWEQAGRAADIGDTPILLGQLEQQTAALVKEMRDYQRGPLCAS